VNQPCSRIEPVLWK